jgi:methionyl aminopeptidase
MIHYKSDTEVELIKKSAELVGLTIAEVAKFIKPGVTTLYLDSIAESFIMDLGALPSFKGYNQFPYASCISVNDAVVHGFPGNYALQDGDILSVDIGVFYKGYHGDSAYTFAIGNVDPEILQLMQVTKESLYLGIEKAVAGNRIGDISFAIQDYAEKKHGYGVVRDLVGHGLGKKLHEDPQVPNYGKRGTGHKMQPGLVLAIEPMINLGTHAVITEKDGWTIKTKDRKVSVHYEHDVCVRKNKAEILSSFTGIEIAEKANTELNSTYTMPKSIAS